LVIVLEFLRTTTICSSEDSLSDEAVLPEDPPLVEGVDAGDVEAEPLSEGEPLFMEEAWLCIEAAMEEEEPKLLDGAGLMIMIGLMMILGVRMHAEAPLGWHL